MYKLSFMKTYFFIYFLLKCNQTIQVEKIQGKTWNLGRNKKDFIYISISVIHVVDLIRNA